jgi:hypothetical protein
MTVTDFDARFFRRFSQVFLSDDIGGFMKLIDDECVWEIMATGEVFAGAAKVRELAERSVAGRTHTADVHMTFVDHFITDHRMCLEYVHEAIVTDKWPASENRPAVGARSSSTSTNISTWARPSPGVGMPGCIPKIAKTGAGQ